VVASIRRWWANLEVSAASYRRIVLATIGVFALITVTGVGVRVTGSGLGCEQWPQCNDDRFVAELTDGHSLIEFGNRLISGLVLLPVVGCVLGALRLAPRRRDLVRWSLALFAVLAVEIPLGGVTVLLGLVPAVVMAHFLVSMALVAMAVVLLDRASGADGPAVAVVGRADRRLGAALVVLASLVVVTGTVVTGAGPHGGDPGVERLPLEIERVAQVHSGVVWAFLAVTVVALWRTYRQDVPAGVRRRAGQLTAAVVVQGAIGYTQYALAVPPALVALHVAGALAVWICALRHLLGLVRRDGGAEPTPGAARHEVDPRGDPRDLAPLAR
jgi:heme a synthase